VRGDTPPQELRLAASGRLKLSGDGEHWRTVVTFGQYLRGLRLGFHWSERIGGMVRMDAQGPPWRIDLCPADQMPRGVIGSKEHRCWWDTGDVIFDLIPRLVGVRKIKAPITLYVDDEGQ
jgi:hypothetical protein